MFGQELENAHGGELGGHHHVFPLLLDGQEGIPQFLLCIGQGHGALHAAVGSRHISFAGLGQLPFNDACHGLHEVSRLLGLFTNFSC